MFQTTLSIAEWTWFHWQDEEYYLENEETVDDVDRIAVNRKRAKAKATQEVS